MEVKYKRQEKVFLKRCSYMKWHFLTIAMLAALQGALLAWNEWMQWREFEDVRSNPDGSSQLAIVCGAETWPPMAAMWISIIIFVFCLHCFFKLNSIIPILGQRLKILTRP